MDLKSLRKDWVSTDETKRILNECTIFDKIEFSDISKEEIRKKLIQLDTQVKNRTVYLELNDRDVKEHWFKNWLHPKLKHFVVRKQVDKYMSKELRNKTIELDFLYTYENGQHNFKYTLDDIEKYVEE